VKQEEATAMPLSLSEPSDFDVIAEKTVQVTNEEQHIVWEGYGLRLHIPPNSLPEDLNQCNIKIEVAPSGNFQLPEDGVLVSAVYSFSHDLGDKELRRSVTLEMQHCATSSVLNDLRVVRAVDVPYKFEILPGGNFARSDGYGAIDLSSFSRFSTFLRRVRSLFSSPNPFEYCAKVYYTNIFSLQFDFEFLIIRDLDTLAEATEAKLRKRDNKFEYGPSSKVEFEENKIALDIPTSTCDGWSMECLNRPLVRRVDVDNYTPRRTLVTCQVRVYWVQEGNKPPRRLSHNVKLLGAKEFAFLTVTSPRLCIDSIPAPGLSPVRSIADPPPSLPELLQLKVHQQVGPHYKIFGTFLLNDKTGSQVDSIKRACLGDPKDIVVSILQEWIAGRGKPLTWGTLIKTLRDCDLNPLADEVEDFVAKL
jgi:hypothetical protein